MMRKLVLCAAAIVLLAAIPFVSALLFDVSLPAPYTETYYAALPQLTDRLDQADGRKVVIIGTSNVAFGCDSRWMEQQLIEAGYECTVCNFGLYGALGTRMMLEMAEASIHDGDLVVIAPELYAQCTSRYFSADEAWRALDGRYDLVLRLSSDSLVQMAAGFFTHVSEKNKYAADQTGTAAGGVYAAASFDSHGDLVNAERSANIMPGGLDANNPITPDMAIFEESFVDDLNAFARRLQSRGAQLVFSYPPMNAAAVQGDADAWQTFEQELAGLFSFPVISSVQDYVLEAGWFYDSNFHLNTSGMRVRSGMLVRDIERYLGLTETAAALPDMPALSEVEVDLTDEDNSCAALFLADQADGCLIITGVTETGKQAERLTVPVTLDGMRVKSVAEDAFAGCGSVREIVFQANITALPDRLFADCASLEQVCVRNADPDTISVGWYLLDGAPDTVRIAVPAGSVAAYQNNYFWGHYMGRYCADESIIAESQSADITDAPMHEEIGQITYMLNGGSFVDGTQDNSITSAANNAHLRMNTDTGSTFSRSGYTFIGWNTKADGTGTHIGPGSRVTVPDDGQLTLYAEWVAWLPESDFVWRMNDDGTVALTGYTGPKDADPFAVPGEIGGEQVTVICKGFAKGCTGQTLILPRTLDTVEVSAFKNCGFTELYFSDNITCITDSCFTGTRFATVHICAVMAPVFQKDNEIAAFADHMDRLILAAAQQKMVFFGGCSMCYGLKSGLVAAAFPDYRVLDMGVIGGTNAAFQLACITACMGDGDVFIHAPEVASGYQLMADTGAEPRMFAVIEGNFDLLTMADLSQTENLLLNFQSFNEGRRSMTPGSYTDTIDVYNEYGDIEKERPSTGINEGKSDGIYVYEQRYVTSESMAVLADCYRQLEARGVSVLFSFAPVNEDGLPDADRRNSTWLSFEKAIRETLDGNGCTVISEAKTYLLRGSYFYDTDYHLNDDGAVYRTKCLIRDIQTWTDKEDTRR